MSSNSSRWLGVLLCVAFAALMLACGWLVPIHLRAVDSAVLQKAGEGKLSLVERGQSLEHGNNADAARLILQAAQEQNVPWAGELAAVLSTHAESERIFANGPTLLTTTNVTAQVIRLENRSKILTFLEANGSPAVTELLRARDLTNTAIFPPSSSASGQAFDAAVSIGGLLMVDNALSPGLRDVVVERAASARTRQTAQALEEILMDLMSLGQRMNWGELTAFVGSIDDTETLGSLTAQARNAGTNWPTLFAAVVLSRNSKGVTSYLNEFSQTGMADLGASLKYGEGGINELLARHQRLYISERRQRWTASGPQTMFFRAATDYALRTTWFALMVKWFFYISGGFLLAAAAHWAQPAVSELEEPLRVPGIHLAREFLFALGFLLVVLLLSEPFLAQESQKTEFAFRLRLPLVGAAITHAIPAVKKTFMSANSLITMLLFFVLQGLLYSACLVKLAEIRRQNVPARVKLKLLENEDHLFDGGLYLGFAGTIVCLIMVSLGITQQTLMAAYSSTSFGVIFVSIFKIFNLRPVRRQFVMQAEMPSASDRAASAAPSLTSA